MISRRLLLPIDMCMIVFAISAVFGIFTAYDQTLSTPIGLTVLISVALYFITAYLAVTWEIVYSVSAVLMAAGTAVALFFITQYGHQNYPGMPDFILRIGQITTILPDSGATMHPNSAATFLEGIIPVGLFLAVTARKPGLRPLWIILTLIMVYAVFISDSRGAWIGLAIAVILGVATFSRRFALITGAVIALVIVGMLVIGVERLSFMQSALAWANTRYELYRNSLYVIGDYAITGVGLGDVFALIYSHYGLLIRVPFLTYTHNLPLAVWFGQGILGLIAFVGIVVTFGLYVRHVLLLSAPRRLFLGTWLGVAATFAHGLFDARQYAEAYWMMPVVFVLIGLSAALGRLALIDASRRSREVNADFVPMALPIGAVVVTAIAGVIFFPQLRAIWATNQGALDETRAELAAELDDIRRTSLYENALKQYQTALSFDPNWPNANRRLGNLDVKLAHYADAVPLLESAYTVEGDNPATVKGLGLAYTWTGRTDDAAEILDNLPQAEAMKDELGTWGFWRSGRGEYHLAAYAYETASKMSLDTPNPVLWMATANNFRAADQLDDAREWYERVLRFHPGNEAARTALREMDAAAN